jgi:hypothetical protein
LRIIAAGVDTEELSDHRLIHATLAINAGQPHATEADTNRLSEQAPPGKPAQPSLRR